MVFCRNMGIKYAAQLGTVFSDKTHRNAHGPPLDDLRRFPIISNLLTEFGLAYLSIRLGAPNMGKLLRLFGGGLCAFL